MPDSISVLFTKDELWVLQGFVRHETGQPWQGAWPNFSKDLNDQIANALLFCEDESQLDAAIVLSKGDCYAIDSLVPNSLKSAAGTLVGRAILLKTFRVRSQLEGSFTSTADEPTVDVKEIERKLEEWKANEEAEQAKKPARRRRSKT